MTAAALPMTDSLLGTYRRAPMEFVRADGVRLFDASGKPYLDFASGIAVNALGYNDAGLNAAIAEATATGLIHTSNLFRTGPGELLADKLVASSFADRVFFCNSGAEANEGAFKFARRWARNLGGPAKHEILSLRGAFHGRLFGTVAATDRPQYRNQFRPLAGGIHIHERNLEELARVISDEMTAAVIAEPIQGEGGFVTPPPEYFAKLQAICRKYGIVLVIDEVQTAMGRTGKLFAIEHWGIAPDVVTTAKSLGGGLPLGAVTGRAELMDHPHVGGLGGTFGGNPVACRAALAVLEVLLGDGLLARAERLGVEVRRRLDDLQRRFEIVGDVRGKGPMLAIELVRDREKKTPAGDETKRLVKRCYEKGLVLIACGNHGNVIRTLMPLVITDAELDRGFQILDSVLEEISPR